MTMKNIKESFFRLLNRTLGIFDIEFQKEILLSMQREWIPEYHNSITENTTTCPKCKRCLPTEQFKYMSDEEISEDVFIDYTPSGEGEIYGDVKYLVEYIICPRCERKSVKSKKELDILNKHLK